jgi:hypothetical protein
MVNKLNLTFLKEEVRAWLQRIGSQTVSKLQTANPTNPRPGFGSYISGPRTAPRNAELSI